jgi:hypothetical protein
MLSLLVTLVVAQRTVVMPNGPAPKVAASSAVAVLLDPSSSWERRSAAVQALEHVARPLSEATQAQLVEAFERASAKLPPCRAGAGSPCQVEFGPCTSHRSFLLAALAASTGVPAPAAQTLALARIEEPQAPAMERQLAFELLARAAHPAAERVARGLLNHPEYACQTSALGTLAGFPSLTDETGDVLALALRSGSIAELDLGALLAGRTEPWAPRLLKAALRHPSGGIRRGVVRGAALRPSGSAELKRGVLQLATCDPLLDVREEAKAVLRSWRVSTPAIACQSSGWKQQGRVVTGRDGGVSLDESRAPPGGACLELSKVADAGSARTRRGTVVILGDVGGSCVLGLDHGEFGGALLRVVADGGAEVITERSIDLNPEALIRRGDERLVISGLEHMHGSGAVGRLDTRDGGSLSYAPLASLDGVPRAWAATTTHLFLAFDAASGMRVCPGQTGEVIFIYGADGSFAVADGPASRCLSRR